MAHLFQYFYWCKKILINSFTLFFLGVILVIIFPCARHWKWDFWYEFNEVKINTLFSVFLAFVLIFFVLKRFLTYPGTSSFIYVIPTVSIIYAVMMGVIFFGRFEYSRAVILESYLLSTLSCWAVYFLRRRYYIPKYALLPFGNYKELLNRNIIEWKLLELPSLDGFRFDGVVADLQNSNISAEWENFLANCALSGIPVYHLKQITENFIGRVKIEHLHENQLGSLLPSPVYISLKRAIDILSVLIAIPLFGPLMLITAILIKVESPGSILFVQNRVGKGNKDFCIYKFRSMRADSEKDGAQFARVEDMRVTKVGKIIRKLRIDELPQFFNILKGDMSLIGPRPEQRTFVDQFEKEIPFYSYRHIVRPGITGWAQVMQGYAASTNDTKVKVEYDFYYIKNFSMWLDILIIFKTIRTILSGFGAR